MSTICLGLSHRTAPVSLRECLSFSSERLAETVVQYAIDSPLTELVVLSTCNRVELYAACSETETADPEAILVDFLTQIHQISAHKFVDHLYRYNGTAVAHHLCRVACGLDSLVLGEPQIQGQVTDAFAAAQAAGLTGPELTALFQTAIRCGKRARTETAISQNPASISSMAVRLAEEIVDDITHSRVLVIGVGETGQLVLKALSQRRVQQIDVVNRTYEHAVEMAAQWGGRAYPFDRLAERLREVDLVVTATGAPHLVLDVELVQRALNGRFANDKAAPKLVIIDIAVPRDVASDVATLPGVHLFDVDGLESQVEASLQERQQEVPKVEVIITEEIAFLRQEWQQLQVRPLIADLRLKAESIRRHELERTRSFLGEVDDDTWKHVERLSQALVNKLLHEPTLRLRDSAMSGHSEQIAQTVRHLFALEEES